MKETRPAGQISQIHALGCLSMPSLETLSLHVAFFFFVTGEVSPRVHRESYLVTWKRWKSGRVPNDPKSSSAFASLRLVPCRLGSSRSLNAQGLPVETPNDDPRLRLPRTLPTGQAGLPTLYFKQMGTCAIMCNYCRGIL